MRLRELLLRSASAFGELPREFGAHPGPLIRRDVGVLQRGVQQLELVRSTIAGQGVLALLLEHLELRAGPLLQECRTLRRRNAGLRQHRRDAVELLPRGCALIRVVHQRVLVQRGVVVRILRVVQRCLERGLRHLVLLVHGLCVGLPHHARTLLHGLGHVGDVARPNRLVAALQGEEVFHGSAQARGLALRDIGRGDGHLSPHLVAVRLLELHVLGELVCGQAGLHRSQRKTTCGRLRDPIGRGLLLRDLQRIVLRGEAEVLGFLLVAKYSLEQLLRIDQIRLVVLGIELPLIAGLLRGKRGDLLRPLRVLQDRLEQFLWVQISAFAVLPRRLLRQELRLVNVVPKLSRGPRLVCLRLRKLPLRLLARRVVHRVRDRIRPRGHVRRLLHLPLAVLDLRHGVHGVERVHDSSPGRGEGARDSIPGAGHQYPFGIFSPSPPTLTGATLGSGPPHPAGAPYILEKRSWLMADALSK